MRVPVRRLCAVAVGAAVLALGGCAFGPLAVKTNRLRYNEAVRQTWNEQFLLNMVRLRYRDPSQFDSVTNILSSHSFDAGINGREEIRTSDQLIPKNTLNSSLFNLFVGGWSGNISERPTITFSPLEGPEFTKHLLGHIHLETLVLLTGTGWDIDRILRVTVHEMNQLKNIKQVAGARDRAPPFEEFAGVARQLRLLQQKGWLELAYDEYERPLSEAIDGKDLRPADLISAADKKYQFRKDKQNKVVLWTKDRQPVLRIAAPAWADPCKAAKVADQLNLVPGTLNYRLIAGGDSGQLKPPPAPGTDLVVTTRSVLGTLLLASRGVEIPQKHYEQGLVKAELDENGQPFDWTRVTGDLIQVRSRKLKPKHAFVAVKYRGYWFYIDDSDLTSKSTFALILEIFGLELAGGVAPGPVITVPVAGGIQVAPGSGGGRSGGGRSGGSSQ